MIIYKILQAEDWQTAQRRLCYSGSALDIKDGYIHFSSGEQVQETASRHFAGQRDLLLVAFESTDLGDALLWEPSRNGQLFPHLYSDLDPNLALSAVELPWDGNAHVFPGEKHT